MYGDRAQMRQQFVDAWSKHKAGTPLTPLEAQLADVIAAHPEYHATIETTDAAEADFPVEDGQTNPYLHMSLHLAIRDQVNTNLPPGIKEAFSKLVKRLHDPLEAEHQCMECLANEIWQVQRYQREFEPQQYLDCLRKL